MKKKRFIYFIILLALLILCIKYSDSILGFAGFLWSLVTPLILGCVIAYILNILVTRIESLPCFSREDTLLGKVRRPISILGSLAVIIAIGVLVILIVIPQLVQAIGVIAKEIPTVVSEISVWLSSFDKDWPQLQKFLESLNVNWPQILQKAASYLTNGLSSVFSSTMYIVSTISSIAVTAVVALIFSIYILSGREKLFHQFQTLASTYLNEKFYKGMCVVLKTAHDTFTKFIVGQCTEAVILGTLCTIGMLLFRFPYATMIGTLIGATALLPVVGAYLGAAVGAFMIFTIDPLKALGFLIFIAILQQLEGNLIYPRVVGSSVGLPGIWVLAAVTVGGGLGGIIGMLLAVPVTATLYKLLQKDVQKRKAALQPKKEEGLSH
ncbi:MAG TPA: AI-2E family transporter [Candidatus Blautia stercorigallinarum]|uniref:AI-2E family transporter n=1 Tax=Candidatus Blautia stercorigallinarum TaxID=2838501 RepID=A0A9D1TH42_9FIRM|nr:AI-2E family transporter [Candidatus Blautia stercorigallinarum]